METYTSSLIQRNRIKRAFLIPALIVCDASSGFPSVSTSVGFNTQGCREPAGCNATSNGTLLGVTYQLQIDCCSTDKCNPVQLSGAPSARMTLTAALGAAVLASVFGSIH